MIHSARLTVPPVSDYYVYLKFVLFRYILKSGWMRHVRKQWSLPPVTLSWPSGSIIAAGGVWVGLVDHSRQVLSCWCIKFLKTGENFSFLNVILFNDCHHVGTFEHTLPIRPPLCYVTIKSFHEKIPFLSGKSFHRTAGTGLRFWATWEDEVGI